MAKDPAFLFYPNDFAGGTQGFTIEEKGAYIELLILQHNKGFFTINQAQRALGIDVFNRVWEYLRDKFIDDNGNYFNERLKTEMVKREEFKKSQSEKGKAGAAKRYENLAAATKKDSSGYACAIAIKEMEMVSANCLNSELVKETARKVFNDKIWAEATGMGHSITRDELAKWMSQFNASLVGDNISNFSESTYKKMFGGWLNKQRSKGYKLPEKQKQSTQPLQTLNG